MVHMFNRFSVSTIIFLLTFMATVSAYQIDVPTAILISDHNTAFEAELVNADISKGYSVAFFAPGTTDIFVEEDRITLVLYNNSALYNTTYFATLSVEVKGETQEKKIQLQYQEPRPAEPMIVPGPVPDTNRNPDQNTPGPGTGFFPIDLGISAISLGLVGKILLAIVAVILIIAFFARA